jgi:FKBP-type peptidyl-prolyl cis-trans isomerase FkpA
MLKKSLFVLFTAIVLFGIGSCKDKGPSQEEIDQLLIEQYIADNNLETTKTASGLHYIIYEPGDSLNHPNFYSYIEAKYKGELLDGSVFDDGSVEMSANLNALIPGWIEGLQLIGEGGKIFLIIPSALGYGNREQIGIPENSVLVFNVELYQVYN